MHFGAFLFYLLAESLGLRSTSKHTATIVRYIDDKCLWINVIWGQTASDINFYVIDTSVWLNAGWK